MRSFRYVATAAWLLGAAYAWSARSLWNPGRAPSPLEPAHETYYVVSHLHYAVSMTTAFLAFAGIYFVLERVGARVRRWLAALHFGATFIGVNIIFLPVLVARFAGAPTRNMDISSSYDLFNRISLAGYFLIWVGLAAFLALLIDALWRRFRPSQPLASAP
jgi:heme/copper-type cytochrome/quinol oxidase subunit 1